MNLCFMSANISLGDIIIFAGAVQGIFLSVILWNLNKANRISHRLLATFLFLFSVQMVYFVVWDSKIILSIPHLSMLAAPLDFALGPTFYLYALSLTNKNFRLKATHLLHFVLVGFAIIYFLPFYGSGAAEKINYNQQSFAEIPQLWILFSVASTIQSTIYVGLTVLLLLRHARLIKRYYSDTSAIDLGWIRNLLLVIVFAFVSCVAISFIGWKWANYYSNIIFSFSIYAMGYYGMRQKSIFNDIREPIPANEPVAVLIPSMEDFPLSKKYERSGLTPEHASRYVAELDQLMATEKPFLDAGITLQQLADALHISLHHLSQVLNQNKRVNFFDYINQHRIEEFKQRLANPDYQHYSLLALALDCGFNSKAAFNSAFKKYAGTTPSAYRKNILALNH